VNKYEEESDRFLARVREHRMMQAPMGCDHVHAPAAGRTRRVRVWVHAVRVVETEWNKGNEMWVLEEGQKTDSNGFVSEWLTLRDALATEYLVAGREWKGDWMREGEYVVFTAIEVAEKQGRHWVRLPWCCKFGVSEVAYMGAYARQKTSEKAQGFVGIASAAGSETIGCNGIDAVPAVDSEPKHSFCGRRVGYVDSAGRIVVVPLWPLMGSEWKVWTLEDLLPKALLVAVSQPRKEVVNMKPRSSLGVTIGNWDWLCNWDIDLLSNQASIVLGKVDLTECESILQR
jgi:hypothetical protein